MLCKFHADMNARALHPCPPRRLPVLKRAPLLLLGALIVVLAPGMSWAEKADRGKPMTIEADKPSTVDMNRQIVVFAGNVVITQGTMRIEADRVEVRDGAGGQRTAVATAGAGKLATFRQKRDGVDETLEGRAARIEYDSRADVVRLIGDAQVRRLRGGTPADEITGNLITYDNGAELFSVQGGTSATEGRVRAVLTPTPAAETSPGRTERVPAPPEGEPRR